MAKVVLEDLGRTRFRECWDYQERLLAKSIEMKRAGEVPAHYLLFTEHYPVYTLGKNGKAEHVLLDESERSSRGIEYYHINRGGDITYHGPGQLVAYPVFDLEQFRTDIGWYLRSLEEVIILTMKDFGLTGERSPGETGVWLEPSRPGFERKICAMGIRCSRWVTMHGLAFNVNTDLSFFNGIIPCGIEHKKVSSLQQELGGQLVFSDVKERVRRNFERVFAVDIVEKMNTTMNDEIMHG